MRRSAAESTLYDPRSPNLVAKRRPTLKIFFDCETFNQFEDGEELPLILPYLIGACTDEPNSYRVWKGLDSTEQFLKWLFKVSRGRSATLYAFNVDYDFQAIKPFIISNYPHVKISYNLTAQKKFVFGSLLSTNVNIRISDLLLWDKSQSLRRYYDLIWKLSETEANYKEILEKYGIQKLEKLHMEDNYKANMRLEGGDMVYENERGETKVLNLELELAYVKNDVIGLPVLLWHINNFRRTCLELLDLPTFIKDKKLMGSVSIPGFSKRLLGYHLSKVKEALPFDSADLVNSTFRSTTSISDYNNQDNSYFGGFVANNKHITKLQNSFGKDGKPNLVSIDVNSMYPWVMSEGIPCALPSLYKPDGVENVDYVVWHTVYFEKQIEPGVLYKYKPRYDVFNNKFFGDSFFNYVEEAGLASRKVYILDCVYQLFKRACDSHIKIEQTYYQPLSHEITPFVKYLYVKKENPKNQSEEKAIKLVLNSLYGKLAERYHEDYFTWDNAAVTFKNEMDDREDRDSILAGLFITSKARHRLISTILDEIDNGNTFLGCDTDSIKLIVNNPLKIPLHDSKLGHWGLEGWYTDFIHNQKKKKYYMHDATGKYEDKIAVSGISKELIKGLSHEDKVLLFSEENDVLFPKVKNASRRNKYWQICIQRVDVRFNYRKGIDPTHYYKDGKIYSYER